MPGLSPCHFGLAYESTLAIILNDAFAVGSVTLPMENLLDGIPCWIQSDRFLSPLQGLMVSRYPGGYACTAHLGVGLAPTW